MTLDPDLEKEKPMDERKKFEEWVVDMEPDYATSNLERLTGGKGGYRVHNVAIWWKSWQARAELAVPAGRGGMEIRDNHISGAIPADMPAASPAQTLEESHETQVTQNYTAWASHIIEEYQRGVKDGRRSVIGELREWAENKATPDGYTWQCLEDVIAKLDDLLKKKAVGK